MSLPAFQRTYTALLDLSEQSLARNDLNIAAAFLHSAIDLAGTHLWGLIEDRRVDDLLTRIATTAFGPRQVRRPSSTNRLRLAFVMRHVLDTRGGARSFFHLADGLRQHGFETRLYLLESSPESKIQQRFEEAGIPIRLIEPAPQHLKRADNLRQQLKDDAIDVVLNYDMGDWLVGLLALSGGEVPVSIYHHFSDHLFSAGIHLLDCHLAFRRAGLRSCQDNHETARCAYLPLPGSDVAPVVERSLETRHTLGIPPEATVSITVTNLNKLAGSTMYFDVLDRVLKEHPHHHHLLVGGGSPVWVDFAKQEIAARHTANRFHLLGPRKDIGALLAGSDVFVDSYPIAGYTASLEAMQAGLPVLELTLDRPPIFGIADDLADVRCIAVSEEDFVRLISRYITDRPYRVHVGRDLRDHYQREYAPSVVVARYADFIRTLLADKSAPLSPPSSNTGPRYNAPLQLGNSDERQPQDYLLDGFSAACRSHSLNGRLDITRHLLGQTPVLAGRRRFWSALLQRQQRNANSLLDLTSS